MSGNNIAWYYQNFRFEFRSSLKNLWDSAQRFWWIPHPIEKWSEELTSNEPWNDASTEDKLQWGIKLSIRITIKKKHLMRWHRGLKRYHFKKVIKILWLFFFLSRINERQSKRPRENFKREPVINVPTNENIHLKKEQSPDRRKFIEEAQNAIQLVKKKAERSLCCHANCSDYFHCSDRTVNVCNDRFVAGIIIRFF